MRYLIRFATILILSGIGTWFIYKHYQNEMPGYVPITQENNLTNSLGGEFILIDQYGKTRKASDFKNKYMLVYFGYAFCPDICPLGLYHISQALKMLKGDRDQVVPIFITIDPERDTVKNLKTYAQNYDPAFVMLTGKKAAINKAIKMYRVYANKTKPKGTSADYLMDHSTLVYLMDREGKYLAHFPHNTPPQEMAEIIIKHLLKDIKKDKKTIS